MSKSFRTLKNKIYALEEREGQPNLACRTRFNFAKCTLTKPDSVLSDVQYNYVLVGGQIDLETPDQKRYNKKRRDNKECDIDKNLWHNMGGVYFVSNNQVFPNAPTTTLKRAPVHIRREVKIGMAGNSECMHKRLNTYLLYWPMGVVVYGVILVKCTRISDIKDRHLIRKKIRKIFPNVKTTKEMTKWFIRTFEIYVHNYFKHVNKRYRLGFDLQTRKTHGHLTEWFVLRPDEISSFLTHFHSNVHKNIEKMMACYTGLSLYLIVLNKLYKCSRCCRYIKQWMHIQTFRENWCHFKSSSVNKRIGKAKNQLQTLKKHPSPDCLSVVQRTIANKEFLSEIPIRSFHTTHNQTNQLISPRRLFLNDKHLKSR